MYKGIQQFHLYDLNKERKRAQRNKSKLPADKKPETAVKDGGSLVPLIRCDPSWSSCFFDFTHMSAINDHFVYRVGRPRNLQALIVENYFGAPDDSFIGDADSLRLTRHFPSALASPDISFDLSEERKQLVPAVSPRHAKEHDAVPDDSFVVEQQNTIFKERQHTLQADDNPAKDGDLLMQRSPHFCSHERLDRLRSLLSRV